MGHDLRQMMEGLNPTADLYRTLSLCIIEIENKICVLPWLWDCETRYCVDEESDCF